MKVILTTIKSNGDLGQDAGLADKFLELDLYHGKLPGIKRSKTNKCTRKGTGKIGQGRLIMVPQTTCPH